LEDRGADIDEDLASIDELMSAVEAFTGNPTPEAAGDLAELAGYHQRMTSDPAVGEVAGDIAAYAGNAAALPPGERAALEQEVLDSAAELGDGAAELVPAQHSPAWDARGFAPEDLEGWEQVPGDDSLLYSADGNWAYDAADRGGTLVNLTTGEAEPFPAGTPDLPAQLRAAMTGAPPAAGPGTPDIPESRRRARDHVGSLTGRGWDLGTGSDGEPVATSPDGEWTATVLPDTNPPAGDDPWRTPDPVVMITNNRTGQTGALNLADEDGEPIDGESFLSMLDGATEPYDPDNPGASLYSLSAPLPAPTVPPSAVDDAQPHFYLWPAADPDTLHDDERDQYDSPDGKWSVVDMIDGSQFLVDNTTGTKYEIPDNVTTPAFITANLSSPALPDGDALDLDTGTGDAAELGVPVPVRRYRPGAGRRDAVGGHRRGWVVRPYGMRAADYRGRERAEAIRESWASGDWDAEDVPAGTPKRLALLDAAEAVGMPERTLRRIETAENINDIIDSVGHYRDGDALDLDLLPEGTPGNVRDALVDAIVNVGRMDRVGDPLGPITASEDEISDAVAKAEEAERIAGMPAEEQAAQFAELLDANMPILGKTTKSWLDGGMSKVRGRSRRWLLTEGIRMLAEDPAAFTAAEKRSIANILHSAAEKEFADRAEKAYPGSREEQLYRHLATRMRILANTITQGSGIGPSASSEEAIAAMKARAAAVQQLLNAPAPPPTRPGQRWMYLRDHAVNPDYSSPAQQDLAQAVDDAFGGARTTVVDAFGDDSEMQKTWSKMEDDYAALQRRLSLPGLDNAREHYLARLISQANFLVASNDDKYPAFAELRDKLVEFRRNAHASAPVNVNDPFGWDLDDPIIQASKDALQPYIGMGTSEGDEFGDVSKALGDALEAAPGSPARYAALQRARFKLHAIHGAQTAPIMHAMNIPVNNSRLRRLADPTFRLAEANLGPVRRDPRGTPWTDADLDALQGLASRQRQTYRPGDTSPIAQYGKATAKLMESAIEAYRAKDYGAFEALNEIVASRLLRQQSPVLDDFIALRDTHWGDDLDWAAEAQGLASGLESMFGYVPTSESILSQDEMRTRPNKDRMYNAAMALIANALKRSPGSTEQRVKLASALWYLNQVDDDRARELRNMLLPWDPNTDVRERREAPEHRRRRMGPATDARVARAQGLVSEIQQDGPMTRGQIEQRYGLTPGELSTIIRRLGMKGVDILQTDPASKDLAPAKQVINLGGGAYRAIPNQFGEKVPLTDAEIDLIILKALAGGFVASGFIAPSPVAASPGPGGFTFIDPRIAVAGQENGPEAARFGLVAGAPGEMHPNVFVWWDMMTGEWVLSASNAGGWNTFGDPVDGSGLQSRRYPTLEGVRVALSALADMNRVPFPADPVVASLHPEDVSVEVVGTSPPVVVVVVHSEDEDSSTVEDDLIVVPAPAAGELFDDGLGPELFLPPDGPPAEPFGVLDGALDEEVWR
jgi:hypothetical protein